MWLPNNIITADSRAARRAEHRYSEQDGLAMHGGKLITSMGRVTLPGSTAPDPAQQRRWFRGKARRGDGSGYAGDIAR